MSGDDPMSGSFDKCTSEEDNDKDDENNAGDNDDDMMKEVSSV